MLRKISIFKIFLIFIIIQGCTPMNKITYLNDSQVGEWDVSPVPPKHHLEIGDILMVKVISRNAESNDLFNIENSANSANASLTAANLYLNGFIISQEGTIDIPNVGEIFILNQTLEEAEETILKKAEDYLINPFVVVKLANFEFTILGEINSPGNYPVYKEGITIYDAIAMAGDITDYGNLKQVKIIRSHKNKKQIYLIDLTGSNVLSSDFYYLRNNDLIYIQPLKFKGFRKSQSQVLLSTLTTIAVLFNVYLKIAE
jgi:polysaccharide export outer membrane protein